MWLKNRLLFLPATLFLSIILCIDKTSAQQGSLYFSVGYNKAYYEPSMVTVEQDGLGNSYTIKNVKGDNNTKTAISALQLNYRLGYYCNYEQTLGLEIGFDPVDYRIRDGQNVTIKGTINNVPNVSKTINFAAKDGYYYYFNGANLLLLNVVSRIGLYHTNSKNLRVDLILKGGVGPALPHFQNSLPIDPINDPQLQYGGFNVGAEAALRVSVKRYFYAEFAGKYDYANLSSLTIYDGTVQQQLYIHELIGCIGFTIPTTKYNPLFWRQHVITIRPLYEAVADSLDKQNEEADEHFATGPMQDIPEFDEIVDKRTKEYNDSLQKAEDSIRVMQYSDSLKMADSLQKLEKANNPEGIDSVVSHLPLDATIKADSTLNKGQQDSTDNKKHKKRKKHKKDEEAQVAPVVPDATGVAPEPPASAPPADAPVVVPDVPVKADNPDTKEIKKEEKAPETPPQDKPDDKKPDNPDPDKKDK